MNVCNILLFEFFSLTTDEEMLSLISSPLSYFSVISRMNDFDYSYEESASPADFATTPNPATPGYQTDTPSPVGPYTPQTPGSTYSPYHHTTPSPGTFQGKLRGVSTAMSGGSSVGHCDWLQYLLHASSPPSPLLHPHHAPSPSNCR